MVLIKVLAAVKNYLFYITPERMDGCNRFGKKVTLDDRWMAQAAPLRKNEWRVATSLYKWNNTLL